MAVSKQDWINAGLQLLREQGEHVLTVATLCQTLGLTKGSFYHHFGDVGDFHAALLHSWEQELTAKPIKRAKRETDLHKRTQTLNDAVRHLDHRLDCSVRTWAMRNNMVKTVVRRVDKRRLKTLTELHQTAGHAQAAMLAQLEYAAFVGAQHLGLIENGQELNAALHTSLALLSKELQDATTRKRLKPQPPRENL